MKAKSKLVRLTSAERKAMFHLWSNGHTYAEIAKMYNTYRQKPRAVVLSFKPSPEEYRRHDHFWRLRQLRKARG